MIEGGARVYGYRFDGYWQDVGTVQSYWEANLALLSDAPELDLYDREWVIHTRSEERAPAKIGATAQVHRSLDQPRLRDQRLGRELGALARRRGRRRARWSATRSSCSTRSFDRAPWWTAPSSTRKSPSGRARSSARERTTTSSTARAGRLNTGITVVGKRAVIPRGVRIGRNVLIGEGVRAADFTRG